METQLHADDLQEESLGPTAEFVEPLFAVVFVGIKSWLDALAIATVVIFVNQSTRKLLAVASVIPFAAAFPPCGGSV